MFNTDSTTKTFIFAVTKYVGTEQLIVKVKYVAESYQKAKDALSEMLSEYSVTWMGQLTTESV
ncbi:hypothetical protein [Photorhabdus luminescens]|uniref:Host cell division inhibitor Icd-like protein n=1 Tax=Photorhabdus luminescens subsp. mexicana TaxID=2100167 RepID=A0A4R4J3W8_PHOLU|nr:hypothetical protein [Photorhabdus luminescens]TDB48056.1 hypothetical protein C5468_16765 [Photorhabdus luminescens subsp. mexicana]